MRRKTARGFTLVEMAVVLGIIAALSALAYDGMRRARPRATYTSTVTDVQSLLHVARQQALASGVSVGVLIFPSEQTSSGVGRIVVLQDTPIEQGPSFFTTSTTDPPLNLSGYVASSKAYPPGGQLVAALDLPQNVLIGPATGLGVANPPFPYNRITTNVACSFCGTDAGAIVFDSEGRPTFYARSGATVTYPLGTAPPGGAFSIYGADLPVGTTSTTSTLVIPAPQGLVKVLHNG